MHERLKQILDQQEEPSENGPEASMEVEPPTDDVTLSFEAQLESFLDGVVPDKTKDKVSSCIECEGKAL